MTVWSSVSIGEVCDLKAGFAFKSKSYTDKGIRLLRGDNIAQGMLRWENAKYWPEELAQTSVDCALNEGDVVLAMDRPWITAGLKWSWIKKSDLPALLVQRVARLRVKNGLDQTFLRYIIGAPAFTDHVLSILTGVNVPHISGRDIQAYRFSLPPLSIQKQIAGILSAYDDLIAVNERRIAILEEMARRVFESSNHNENAISFADLVIDSIGGTWGNDEPDEVNSMKVRVIRGTDLPKIAQGILDGIPVRFVKPSHMKRRALTSNSVIVEVSGGSKDQPVGRSVRLSEKVIDHFDAPVTSASFCRIAHFADEVHALSFWEELRSVYSSREILEYQTQSTGISNLRFPDLLEGLICAKAVSKAAYYDASDSLKLVNNNLRATRDLLIPRLISGEIDVSEAPLPKTVAAE